VTAPRCRRAGGPGAPGAYRAHRALVAALVLVAAALAIAEGPEDDAPSGIDIEFEPHGELRWDRGQRPLLVVSPRAGDGWLALAQRYCGSAEHGKRIRAANPGLEQPLQDRGVNIPVEVLRGELRLEAVQRLFPVDRRVADGWEHWVLDPFGGVEESWEWLAELFTGSPDAAGALREANPELPADDLVRGPPLLIPERRLLPAFRDQPVPAAPTPTPPASIAPPTQVTAGPATSAAVLTYATDQRGPYAEYRLHKGEALYSAVVVRFTGQLAAQEVNATALEIAQRSGIADVTSIPVGYPVRIPLDLLLPQYLPANHPRRVAYEQGQRELAGFLEVVKAVDLSGVHVILDAGHGGIDPGSVVDGLWEATYVYDIACRIKANFERHTRATVWVTRMDADLKLAVPERDRLAQDRDQYLLTRPQFALRDAALGVHLRWYLSNDIILNRLGATVPRSQTVFLSVHADSLHPSVRGAMIYVPARELRPNSYTVGRADIQRYAEYRNHPTVRLGADFKARVEASSLHLASNLVASLGRNGVTLHDEDPVRDRVLRGRRTWVPAVIRYSAAQHAVLLECCNMANAGDRQRLVDRTWRESFALAVVEGTAAAFGARP
jgi:N-acetylmuramoyl-L-alanine amidase